MAKPLVEAREPKVKAIVSEISGKVTSIKAEKDNRYEIVIKTDPKSGVDEEKRYLTDSGRLPFVREGDIIKAGDKLSEGLIHPKELLRVSTAEAVENYILREVQKVYRSQGVEISRSR